MTSRRRPRLFAGEALNFTSLLSQVKSQLSQLSDVKLTNRQNRSAIIVLYHERTRADEDFDWLFNYFPNSIFKHASPCLIYLHLLVESLHISVIKFIATN
jgi:hypothetical protein